MARNGYPVIFDATHSVQQPGGQSGPQVVRENLWNIYLEQL